MSLELWTTIGTFGTFVVITVTAVAAMIQLRHLRQSNQLNALLTILQMPYNAVLHDAFDFITDELPGRMTDPEFMRLLDSLPVDRKIHKELYALDYYERLGAYIKAHLVDAAVYLDSSSPERYWNAVKPIVKRIRDRGGSSVYENFEYLVYLARCWDKQHPQGNYPKAASRLDLD
jgi:hypothetical protein